MPLSFKKFFNPSASSRSKNPYAKNPTANSAQYQHKHSSTPDLLAEARQAAGRDPVTGRRVGAAAAGGASSSTSPSSPGLRESRSAYGDMGRGLGATRGTTYDGFVRDMRASTGGGASGGSGSGSGSGNGGGAGAPLGGYYAPAPKMAVEYYAPERGFR